MTEFVSQLSKWYKPYSRFPNVYVCEHAKLYSHKLVYILVVFIPSILLPEQLCQAHLTPASAMLNLSKRALNQMWPCMDLVKPLFRAGHPKTMKWQWRWSLAHRHPDLFYTHIGVSHKCHQVLREDAMSQPTISHAKNTTSYSIS